MANFPLDHFLNFTDTAASTSAANSSFNPGEDRTSNLTLGEINEQIRQFLAEAMTADKFAYYFADFNLHKLAGTVASFTVPSMMIRDLVKDLYYEQIQQALAKVTGQRYSLEITALAAEDNLTATPNSSPTADVSDAVPPVTPAGPHRPTTAKGPTKNAKEAKFTLNLNPTKEDLISKAESRYLNQVSQNQFRTAIDPNKTFDNFIIGPSNNMAWATAKAVAQQPGKDGKYPCLYIYSGSGLGKTHLLHAIANEIREHFPQMRVCLITAREFMKEMINDIRRNALDQFQKKYTDRIDVLMIDDIHELEEKEGTQNEFFHIFNVLHDQGKQLLFTSDKSPSEIDGISERIKTRLQWGLVIDIQRPDLETRISILKNKAHELDLYLSDETFSLIANAIKTNIRELEGALIKLLAHADVMQVEIDPAMVQDILGLKKPCEVDKITLEDIARHTANHFNININDLRSHSRNKNIMQARHAAIYLSQKLLHNTLREIGIYYNGRDHTTVINSIEKAQELIEHDVSYSRLVIQIENDLH